MLVSLDNISLEYGDQPLLSNVDLTIEASERICLIGRNGAGKSSLLKLINGEIQPDAGEIQYRNNVIISKLNQELPIESSATVRSIVAENLKEQQKLIDAHDQLSSTLTDEQSLQELQELQKKIESGGGWNIDHQIDAILTQLELPAETKINELSGGWRRRVALAQALVANPDLLLLDEPTNHLDISTIEWLEHKIQSYSGSVIFITHDRTFLQKLATRIIELDRGNLSSWPGSYENFLQQKEKFLQNEATRNALFDKKLAQEEQWIRQGIKARRKRNEGRVRALIEMREQRAQRLKPQGQARIHMEEAEQSGRKVLEIRNITHGYGNETLIKDFSLKIMRGDRVALIGNNGVGKSTLLKILLGEITPNAGSVKLGTNLELAYFDQLRRELDPNKTIAEAVGDGKDYIKLYGKDRHIIGYLTDFLFTAKRAMTPIKVLSGGERNRVILAKLFTQPANIVVLDEPTNDLDIEMLEVLEQRLVEFNGTLIIVSHDRDFIDNIATSVLVFEEDGYIREYVGGYSDWIRRGKALAEKDNLAKKEKLQPDKLTQSDKKNQNTKKLTYKLQRELDALPGQIEELEKDISTLQQQIANKGFYDQPYETCNQVMNELASKQKKLDTAMERWMELENH